MRSDMFKGINRIITHRNCPDGMASAILLYDALKIKPEFHVHGTEEFQNLKVTPKTLFCDICPPKHLVEKFVKAGGIVLDHHKTAKYYVSLFKERGIFADENNECGISGAYLAFREVWKPLMQYGTRRTPFAKQFARLAGIRDTWQKHEKDWLFACYQAAALIFYPWEYWKNEVDRNGHDDDRYLQFCDEMIIGKLIFENRIGKAKKCVAETYVVTLDGLRVAIFNDNDHLTSDVAELLRADGVNLVVGFFYSKADKNNIFPMLCYSLRSDGSFDVSKFANKLGGGGHTEAAGYNKITCMSSDPFSIFLNDLKSYG